jgi:hypothetical protein
MSLTILLNIHQGVVRLSRYVFSGQRGLPEQSPVDPRSWRQGDLISEVIDMLCDFTLFADIAISGSNLQRIFLCRKTSTIASSALCGLLHLVIS